jgi:hypothetical protein
MQTVNTVIHPVKSNQHCIQYCTRLLERLPSKQRICEHCSTSLVAVNVDEIIYAAPAYSSCVSAGYEKLDITVACSSVQYNAEQRCNPVCMQVSVATHTSWR